jgi:hypothetical protein
MKWILGAVGAVVVLAVAGLRVRRLVVEELDRLDAAAFWRQRNGKRAVL